MEIVVLALLTVIASFIAGVSGFGFAVFLMSFFPMLLGVKDANVLVSLAGIGITIYLFVPLRKKVKWWIVARVLAGMAIGIPAGVWVLVSAFMLILHFTIVIIAFLSTGEIIWQFILASFICTLNLLLTIFLVSLLSLFLPDFIAAVAVIGIAAVSFLSDSFYVAKHTQMFQQLTSSGMDTGASIWRILWPKTAMLQYWASSLIKGNDFNYMGPVPPILNILFFIFCAYAALSSIFNRKEI